MSKSSKKPKDIKTTKVAIVADWLTNYSGAEYVIEIFSQLFPQAPIYTTIFIPEKMKNLGQHQKVRTSYLQILPKFLRSKHQALLPFLPRAIESLDLSNYDLILSSSSFISKGVLTKPETLHISYCHTPARFLWEETHSYLQNYPLPKFIKFFLPNIFSKLRIWDKISADRVDKYIANSDYTSAKIKKAWQKESVVISPPVDFERFQKGLQQKKDNYYLWVGRLVAQKNIDLIIKTFKFFPKKKLIIAGQGVLKKKLKKLAKGLKNIEFIGYIADEDLPYFYGQAKAVLCPQIEDAGIVPLEALSAGTPVIALQKGGVLTTLNKEVCQFFSEATIDSLADGLRKFEKRNFDPKKLSEYAKKFSQENFKKQILETMQSFLIAK